MTIVTVGIDLAKKVFAVHGVDVSRPNALCGRQVTVPSNRADYFGPDSSESLAVLHVSLIL